MKKGWLWPVLVVSLLLVSVTANLVILVVATNDPSFAVEKDYYAKAVSWDEKRAQDARNLALGWKVDLAAVPTVEATAPGLEVVVRVTDATGEPVQGARIRLEAFPVARASQIESVELGDKGAGNYGASMRFTRPGLWEFRIEIVRGEDRFTETVTRELYPVWPR